MPPHGRVDVREGCGKVVVAIQTHEDDIRDEFWDGAPALDVYVVEGYDDAIHVEPETVNELLGYSHLDQSFCSSPSALCRHSRPWSATSPPGSSPSGRHRRLILSATPPCFSHRGW